MTTYKTIRKLTYSHEYRHNLEKINRLSSNARVTLILLYKLRITRHILKKIEKNDIDRVK